MLEVDTVIYIKGKYQKSWRDPNQYELRINDVQLLDEVGSAKIIGIAINLPIQQLTPQLIDQLDRICDKYKGEQQFSVNLLDGTNKIMLQLNSANRRINADSLFTNELDSLGLKHKTIV